MNVIDILGFMPVNEIAKGGIACNDFVELLNARGVSSDLIMTCMDFYNLGKIYGKREERAKRKKSKKSRVRQKGGVCMKETKVIIGKLEMIKFNLTVSLDMARKDNLRRLIKETILNIDSLINDLKND